ncbi:MAG: Gfo/Idh/MocA family oxidoreductase [Yoonia sp.]|uniref:Gfo/Idh/MocA family protein n=1 Tax=Yoonia sp. TaxID=2212373 RepID=UPI0032631188
MEQDAMMNAVLIGLGMVAETHVRAIAAAPDVTLHGIYARNTEKAFAFAQEMTPVLDDTPKVYLSAADIASDTDVDFVIICTPPNARLDLVTACAKAGKPILMEKPVAVDTETATAIVEICEDASVPLGIVFQHRVRESTADLAKRLRSGAMGDIAVVEISVPWWRDQSYYDEPGRGTYVRDGGGVLMSQAIHTLDLALSLIGPVEKVQATIRTTPLHDMEAEDYVTAGLDLASGAVGSLVASTASFPGQPESITLHCTHASATLTGGQVTVQWRDGTTEVTGEKAETGGGADPMAFTFAWHQAIISDFAQAVRDGTAPIASGRSSLQVHHLIDAIVQSSHEKRSVRVQKGP